jgi:hypothetical protein
VCLDQLIGLKPSNQLAVLVRRLLKKSRGVFGQTATESAVQPAPKPAPLRSGASRTVRRLRLEAFSPRRYAVVAAVGVEPGAQGNDGTKQDKKSEI